MAMSRLLGNKTKKSGSKSKKEKKPKTSRKHRSEVNTQGARLGGASETESLPHGLTPVTTPMREEVEVSHFTESDMKEETGGPLPDRELLPGEHLFLELPERYRYTKYLGHGAFGEVCEAKDMEVDIKVAIKKQKGFFGHRKDAKLLLRELRILRLLTDHPNIVKLHDIICPQDASSFDHLYVVFEYVDTDLRKLLDSNQNFTDLHVQYMLYQILLGVKYMHSANIIHRDLKPANILVNANCTLKICDFGLARGLAELTDPSADEPDATPTAESAEDGATTEKKSAMKQHQVTRHVVTRWYRCPEVLLLEQRPGELLKAIDMWSVGCILGDLFKMIDGNHDHSRGHRRRPLFPGGQSYLTNKDPFTWSNQKDQLNVIFNVMGTPSTGEIDQIRDSHAQQFLKSLDQVARQDLRRMFPSTRPEGIDLMTRLLEFLPMDRMNVEDALGHLYLEEIRTPDHELSTDNATFEFEERRIGIPELREKIVREIAQFHPEILGGIVTATVESASGSRSSRRVAGV